LAGVQIPDGRPYASDAENLAELWLDE
jgi:hypothetical protein